MSTNTTTLTAARLAIQEVQKKHRRRVLVASLLFSAAVVALAAYGLDYYMLSAAERPFSPKHEILRPSGVVGINLGFLGVAMFVALFVYALRKHWPWLQKKGNSQRWLDYHILLGIAAPVCVAFHSSFKFRGIAGFSFLIMMCVVLSGFVGRYLYGQIPRRVSAAELSLKESYEVQVRLAWTLASQGVISVADLQPILNIPQLNRVVRWSAANSLFYMVWLDLQRSVQIARLRRRFMEGSDMLYSLGGLLPSNNAQAESIVQLAREHAKLSKRIMFLSRAQQIFRLWHVIHKPFSYAFAALVVVHIAVAMLLGFV